MQDFCILAVRSESCPMFSSDQLRTLQHLYLQHGPCIPLSAVHNYRYQTNRREIDAAHDIAHRLVQWHSQLEIIKDTTRLTSQQMNPFQSRHITVIPDIPGHSGISMDIMSQAQIITLPTFRNPYPSHISSQ